MPTFVARVDDSRASGHAFPPGWQAYAIFGLLPLWWLLGLSMFIWPLIAAPLLATMLLEHWQIRAPRRFGIYLLLVGWIGVSGLVLRDAQRIEAWAWRGSFFVAGGILFLYLLNAPERRLPTRSIVNAHGLLLDDRRDRRLVRGALSARRAGQPGAAPAAVIRRPQPVRVRACPPPVRRGAALPRLPGRAPGDVLRLHQRLGLGVRHPDPVCGGGDGHHPQAHLAEHPAHDDGRLVCAGRLLARPRALALAGRGHLLRRRSASGSAATTGWWP